MRYVALICARGGSKGLPGKNIKLLNGIPLIGWSIMIAKKVNRICRVIVSTDSDEIAQVAKKYGAEVPFIRPKKLATDKSGMLEVLLHGIHELQSLGYDFTTIVSRDCTAPFIRNTDILNSIKLMNTKKPDAVFGVYKQHFNPYFNMMESNSKGFLKISKSKGQRPTSRQSAPVVYQLNGFFVYNVKNLVKYNEQFILPKVLPYEIPEETGLMIDTELEFQIAELMLKHKLIKI